MIKSFSISCIKRIFQYKRAILFENRFSTCNAFNVHTIFHSEQTLYLFILSETGIKWIIGSTYVAVGKINTFVMIHDMSQTPQIDKFNCEIISTIENWINVTSLKWNEKRFASFRFVTATGKYICKFVNHYLFIIPISHFISRNNPNLQNTDNGLQIVYRQQTRNQLLSHIDQWVRTGFFCFFDIRLNVKVCDLSFNQESVRRINNALSSFLFRFLFHPLCICCEMVSDSNAKVTTFEAGFSCECVINYRMGLEYQSIPK